MSEYKQLLVLEAKAPVTEIEQEVAETEAVIAKILDETQGPTDFTLEPIGLHRDTLAVQQERLRVAKQQYETQLLLIDNLMSELAPFTSMPPKGTSVFTRPCPLLDLYHFRT